MPRPQWSTVSKLRLPGRYCGAGTHQLEASCSGASQLRLGGRTLPAGMLMTFAWRLPVDVAVELAEKLAGYWLESTRNLPGSHLKEVLLNSLGTLRTQLNPPMRMCHGTY